MEKDLTIQIRQELQDLEALINEIIQSNFLSDKSYNKITAKIGYIDDVYMKSEQPLNERKYLSWVKQRLDKICQLLVSFEKHSSISLTIDHEDLMHPSGDYYNEDNSISLTEDIKTELTKILQEKYKET